MKKDINNMYIDNLISQFLEAEGLRKANINSKGLRAEFLNWASDRREISKSYLKLLDYMGLLETVKSKDSVEVGKGKYDTIVSAFDTNLITPYTDGLDKNRTTCAIFEVSDGEPSLIVNSDNNIKVAKLNLEKQMTFITQNPYDNSSILRWNSIHNKGEHNIIVGVYGSLCDKDINKKINLIKEFRRKLIRQYVEEFSVTDDNYCYVVATKQQVLIKK